MIEGWKRFRLSQKNVILDTLGMPNVRFDIQNYQKRITKLVKMKFNFYLRQIKELILGY
jgi:hypothetical protein